MNLDDIINTLSATAGLNKQASEDTEKDEKKDEKKSVDFLNKAKSEEEKAEGENDREEKQDEECDEAHEKGAALAKEIAARFAAQTQTKETSMNKQAAAAGAAIADAILQKIANAGDGNTENGIVAGQVPNKAQVGSAQMVAEDDAKVKPLPTKNAIGNGGGSLNQIFDAIVADTLSQGAVSVDQGMGAPGMAAHEGNGEEHATPNQVNTQSAYSENDEAEKVAAVNSLVSEGFSFDDAVNMVKSAAEEIQREEVSQVKQAALDNLIAAGVDFDSAVALVKQANLGAFGKSVGGMVGNTVAQGAKKVGAMAARNPGAAGAIGAAGAVGVGAGVGALVAREKKAAMSALTAQGVDFATAAALVNQKSQELYGF
jgi:hypothetical protein